MRKRLHRHQTPASAWASFAPFQPGMQQFHIRLVFSGLNSTEAEGDKATPRLSVHVLESQPFEPGEALPARWDLHRLCRTEAALAHTTKIELGQSQTQIGFGVVSCLQCPVAHDAVVNFQICAHPHNAKSSASDAKPLGSASCKVGDLFAHSSLTTPVVSMQSSPNTTVGHLFIELLHCPCQRLQIQAPPQRAERASRAARLSQAFLLGSPEDQLLV